METLYSHLNQIWLHGTAEQKEELRQVLLGLSEELGLSSNLTTASESLTIKMLQTGLSALQNKWTPPQRDLLASFMEDQVRAIAAARQRDITLI